jgi:NTP pyrophosphatase (non-canonical NTP hydrolase)
MIGSDHRRFGLAGELPHIAGVIAEHLRRNGFDPADAINRQILNLAEEAGEFVGAYRRWSGQARRTGTAGQMHAELADVIITAFVTAHELGLDVNDINEVLAAKLHTVFTRGWRECPATTTAAVSATVSFAVADQDIVDAVLGSGSYNGGGEVA